MSERRPVSLESYMKKVAAIVRENPALAPAAYARAAEHVRGEMQKPENRGRGVELLAIARAIDGLAAQESLGVDPQTDAGLDVYESPLQFEDDALVEDFAQAKAGAKDELEESALFEQIHNARRQGLVPPVQITPQSAGSNNNRLSDTVLIRYGGSASSGTFVGSGGVAGPVVAKQETQVIRWDGDISECVPCRVALSPLVGGANANYPTATDAAGNSYSYRPFFHAFWGSGDRGQVNEVYGDVGRGTQFTVSANHIYVNVGMDRPSATVNVSTPVNYVAGAMYVTGSLGFFVGQSQAPVTRTHYIDQLAVGATSTFTVPTFAKSLLPPQSTSTAGQTTLDFQDASGYTLYSLLFTNGTLVSPIPLGNDIYQVVLTNTAGATAAYRCVFQLAL